MSGAGGNWRLRRLRPRHYLLVQRAGGTAAPHFLVSRSVDDESEYVHFRDPATRAPDSWARETIHRRSPEGYSKLSAAENIARVIAEHGLPPLDVAIDHDRLFADVGIYEDIDPHPPTLEEYGGDADAC